LVGSAIAWCVYFVWPSLWVAAMTFLGSATVVGLLCLRPVPQEWFLDYYAHVQPTPAIIQVLAIVVVILVCGLNLVRPNWGVKPIVIIGSAVMFLIVALAWVPHSPSSTYVPIKEEVAESTGFRGPLLDK